MSVGEDTGFGRLERENSGKFIMTLKKSADLSDDHKNIFGNCLTPIYTPQYDPAYGASREITLF